jgi:cytidylate kinase
MKTKARSINQIVEEQVQKWNRLRSGTASVSPGTPVITVSREPGSGGKLIAKGLAQTLGLDLFHQEVIHEMAQSARVGTRLLETLDEKGLSVLEDWITSLVRERHLWPDEYSQHLMKVIGTIGKHGRAVIVGRGANFVLPPENRFRVRIVASQEVRIFNVARDFGIDPKEAKRRVIRTESDRRAFIRKYFNADISDPLNYDLVLNTETVTISAAVDGIAGVLKRQYGLAKGEPSA